jgi:iron-sulfur cluster assembly accessory protein
MTVVTLTDSAKTQMQSMLNEHQKSAVKLALQGGGCAGFKYDWSLVDSVEADDEVIELDKGKFVIDSMSVMYLIGSTVDYKKEVFGSYFDISNPASTSSCGCGESVGF